MTGYKSKKAAAQDKLLDDDDALTIAYQSGYYDGKKAANPAQEPVAYLCSPDENGLFELPTTHKACKDCFPVYTTPTQRPLVGLTDDDIFAAVRHLYGTAELAFMGRIDDIATARAIEAALRIKNT